MTGTDSGPPAAPVVLKGDGSPADYSCIGTATAPTGTGDVSITLHAADFLSDAPVGGVTVHFFPDNLPNAEDTCDAPCIEVVTDMASGDATVTANAGAWYAYRILARPSMPSPMPSDPVRTVQYNETAPSSGTATLNSVSQQAIGLIPSFLGRTRVPGTAVISGTIQDCEEDPIQEARFRLFQGGTEIMHGPNETDPIFGHFNDATLPVPLEIESHSTPNGLYAAANIPPGELRVEIWGSLNAGSPEQILGCEVVQAFPDTVTIINVAGLRADGHASCPSP